MGNEVGPLADDYDFSSYRPGDVICIPMREIRKRGQAQSTMLIAAIANAATRAGLEWEATRDEAADEVRVKFT